MFTPAMYMTRERFEMFGETLFTAPIPTRNHNAPKLSKLGSRGVIYISRAWETIWQRLFMPFLYIHKRQYNFNNKIGPKGLTPLALVVYQPPYTFLIFNILNCFGGITCVWRQCYQSFLTLIKQLPLKIFGNYWVRLAGNQPVKQIQSKLNQRLPSCDISLLRLCASISALAFKLYPTRPKRHDVNTLFCLDRATVPLFQEVR